MLKQKSSQSGGCTRIHQKKSKKFKQTLSPCQETDSTSFLGHESSDGGGIHATGDRNNVRTELQTTEHSEQKAWNADTRYSTSS
jgi:hypothetical protein